ncbi:hypothetical protein EDD16DRAFT_1647534 [Pisolithus croceorrhizus]|nr:hypothetical protein EDD16DRAFT_1647534 [Pisolithus croceorrhizus]KAI6110751.1 hypothetical protein EV401DRAFT_1991639 [Pisolithus croceorrhizus]KAI6160862.1 hypothetical protein EDD17DRAFT_1594204 [Pisolithus thermaeus]
MISQPLLRFPITYSSLTAVSYTSHYKSFLLTHTLSVLVEFESDIIIAVFTTSCRSLCCTVDDHWQDLNHCVEKGVIPDVGGI